MKKNEFILKMKEFLYNSGINKDNTWITVGDDPEVNTTIFIDSDGWVYISRDCSVKRIKTSINVANVTDLRYADGIKESRRICVICNDYSGLDICYYYRNDDLFNDGMMSFFQNGYIGHYEDAVEWFETNPE